MSRHIYLSVMSSDTELELALHDQLHRIQAETREIRRIVSMDTVKQALSIIESLQESETPLSASYLEKLHIIVNSIYTKLQDSPEEMICSSDITSTVQEYENKLNKYGIE